MLLVPWEQEPLKKQQLFLKSRLSPQNQNGLYLEILALEKLNYYFSELLRRSEPPASLRKVPSAEQLGDRVSQYTAEQLLGTDLTYTGLSEK